MHEGEAQRERFRVCCGGNINRSLRTAVRATWFPIMFLTQEFIRPVRPWCFHYLLGLTLEPEGVA